MNEEIKIVNSIEELKLNTIYGMIEKDNIRSMYILKGIIEGRYLFDKVVIIQNNNEDKYLAIEDNRGLKNYKEVCKHDLIKSIENQEVFELLNLKDSTKCTCTNCNCNQ